MAKAMPLLMMIIVIVIQLVMMVVKVIFVWRICIRRFKPTLYGAMRLRKLSTASVTDQPIVCLPDSRAASMSIIFSAPFFVVIVIIALFVILQLSLAFCHILCLVPDSLFTSSFLLQPPDRPPPSRFCAEEQIHLAETADKLVFCSPHWARADM